MKVILISASYHPVLGGLQTVTRQLARGLSERGHDVRVIANRYPRSLAPRETVDGVEVERWPLLHPCMDAWKSGRRDLAVAGAWYNPAAAIRFTRLVARFRPDVVNVHFPDARLAFALRVQRRFPFRLAVSLHGDEIERWFKNADARTPHSRQQLERLRGFLRSADAVSACSRYLLNRAAALEPSISEKAQVIHNGLDSSRFADQSAHAHARPYLLAYGRLTYKKGFDLLLRAFAPVAERIPLLDLILAGDGEQRRELEALRESLGLTDRVIFYGRANPEQVVHLLNGCRLMGIPSREEPFGIVAMEAISAGRPMVLTRVGGLPEVVAAASGLRSTGIPLAEWAEPEHQDLTRAILCALSRPAAAGRQRPLCPAFSLEEMTRRYIELLTGIRGGTAAMAAPEARSCAPAAC